VVDVLPRSRAKLEYLISLSMRPLSSEPIVRSIGVGYGKSQVRFEKPTIYAVYSQQDRRIRTPRDSAEPSSTKSSRMPKRDMNPVL
jgi:hypothetical protein